MATASNCLKLAATSRVELTDAGAEQTYIGPILIAVNPYKQVPRLYADDVLRQGVQGISDIITIPGLVNVDFADVKAVMQNAGNAMLGIGMSSGKDRAEEAAQAAISAPLIERQLQQATVRPRAGSMRRSPRPLLRARD